ncbi:AAA family ATPase [Runella sp. CRIBMP]|uniref:AAA family ATPase n=1 Tax=Runella sp. CRIBMP TaxID=2683261 RepID=UPI0014122565|nr:AAA family ATPase [Runella sp. CRIBMP]NBB21060.1 AAA family ATPase [Runella sp. CRIBMP]
MKLQSLHIKNFKSIAKIDIIEPNPFTVFVGPNGSGKSNIFEALEFLNYGLRFDFNREEEVNFSEADTVVSLFGGNSSIVPFNKQTSKSEIQLKLNDYSLSSTSTLNESRKYYFGFGADERINWIDWVNNSQEFRFLVKNFFRIFVKNEEIMRRRLPVGGNSKLNFSASNLAKVLKIILEDALKRDEILDWLRLLIPEFDNLEISTDAFDGESKLKIKEKHTKHPFPKHLISDGTYNILALLTAVYQSDEPQFLCIEEPENGLHPKVIKELVHFFRDACQEKGHYIWLNTHSQTLVAQLQTEEIILVNKKQGETITKQLKNHNLHGLRMDEAWLTAALGGGLPW